MSGCECKPDRAQPSRKMSGCECKPDRAQPSRKISGCECKPDRAQPLRKMSGCECKHDRAQPLRKRRNTMLNRFVLCVVAMVLLVGLLYAHGDPIMGTVTAVTNDNFTIKDKNNKVVMIMLEKTTKYLMNDKPAQKADLKTGVRVVIDAHMDTKMKMCAAEEVKIGTAVPAK